MARGSHGQRRDEANLSVSAATLGEIQAVIETTRKQDPEKAAQIEDWLDLPAGAADASTLR